MVHGLQVNICSYGSCWLHRGLLSVYCIMKNISYFFLGIEYILCKMASYILVLFTTAEMHKFKKKAAIYFYLLFYRKIIIFDSMGNIRGLSGIFFWIIAILIPIKMRKDNIFTALPLLTLWVLNIFNDIYEYRQKFIKEKKNVLLFWIILSFTITSISIFNLIIWK